MDVLCGDAALIQTEENAYMEYMLEDGTLYILSQSSYNRLVSLDRLQSNVNLLINSGFMTLRSASKYTLQYKVILVLLMISL